MPSDNDAQNYKTPLLEKANWEVFREPVIIRWFYSDKQILFTKTALVIQISKNNFLIYQVKVINFTLLTFKIHVLCESFV